MLDKRRDFEQCSDYLAQGSPAAEARMIRTQTWVETLQSITVVAAALIAALSAQAQSADSFNPVVNAYASCVALQPDGKVLVGGTFTALAGQTRNRIGRLNSDGSLDTAFNPGANSSVNAIAVQADWRILVGGSFTTLAGQTRNRIGRLNLDGSLDGTFDPGASGSVTALAVQADGGILVGGDFTTLGGQKRNYLGRFNADGSLDTTFNPGPNGSVFSMAVQPDGRILVAGGFSTLGEQVCSCLGRLNEDGSLDTTFNPAPNSYVYALAIQADGKILAGGLFGSLGGQTRSRLGRLNADGSLDLTFNSGANNYVNSLAVQADGSVLVGGGFTSLGGKTCNFLGRLNSDGSPDTNFVARANGGVEALALQADGKILVEGYFSSLGGQPRTLFGRLNNISPVTDNLMFDGLTISWLRGGAAPEVWRTTFDVSTNGADWISLGPGDRVPGGWQLGGVSLPAEATIRVRGYAAGGRHNGAGWFVETSIGPPAMTLQPGSLTNNAGTTANFPVAAAGAPALTYQWLKNGIPLNDTTNIIGTRTSTLTLSNVVTVDAGDYAVSVSNFFGSTTSHVAALVVVDPFITSQPIGLTNNAGTTATFTVVADGSSPLAYSWLKDGLPLNDAGNASGVHTATLTLSNLLAADAGFYSVRATNLSGNVTSQLAGLVVLDPAIALQPASQGVDFGQPAALTVTAAGTEPLVYQWFKDGSALANATAPCLALTSAQAADAGSYWVVVSNSFGSVTSEVAMLSVNLAMLDRGFGPETVNNTVGTMALQTDGRLLVAGYFEVGGQATNRIARLEADGTLDSTFDAVTDRPASCLAVQPDGKIVVGGEFSTLCGQARRSLGRLNANGSLDESFNPAATGLVSRLVVQPDGRILVAGYFVTLGGQTRYNIGRLNPDGTLDTAFNPGSTISQVLSLAAQPDGGVLVGWFIYYPVSGYSINLLQRLMPDGTVDPGFNIEADGYIQNLALQADGKILVAGEFTTLADQARNHIGRLNADGTPDLAFNPGAGGAFNALVVQADGRILLGGNFSTLGGQTRNNIGRLNADGALDLTFNPGATGSVSSLAIQPDGQIVAGGSFVSLDGKTRQYLGRLINTEAATQNLALTGTTLNWLRSGASPEIWIATFDASADGTTWNSLGAGIRIPGGWQLASPALLSSTAIRARGFVSGGNQNGSAWLVESKTQLLRILVNDGGFGFTSNSTGGFGFNLVAPPGRSVIVEASTDLTNWTALATNTAGPVPLRFDDPNSSSLFRRFYRARLQYIGQRLQQRHAAEATTTCN